MRIISMNGKIQQIEIYRHFDSVLTANWNSEIEKKRQELQWLRKPFTEKDRILQLLGIGNVNDSCKILCM